MGMKNEPFVNFVKIDLFLGLPSAPDFRGFLEQRNFSVKTRTVLRWLVHLYYFL